MQGALGKETIRSCTVEVANGKRSLVNGEETLGAETERTMPKARAKLEAREREELWCLGVC